MGITVKTIIFIYLGIFIFAILVSVGIHISLLIFPPSNENIYETITKFAISMTDVLEISFGALIGALSASLQRVISKETTDEPAKKVVEPNK
ncbi:hypothetical protein QUF74_09595 [Candidatus Halobeggiatoa sp. HSG11]|nr:hypothetical protein [Candidatus Halobeggiatoa sp. HSG11]